MTAPLVLIVAAAIKVGKLTITAAPPARHGDLIFGFAAYNRKAVIKPSDQGFLTSAGRFVSREEAHRLAWMAGQIKREAGAGGELFSEDLW